MIQGSQWYPFGYCTNIPYVIVEWQHAFSEANWKVSLPGTLTWDATTRSFKLPVRQNRQVMSLFPCFALQDIVNREARNKTSFGAGPRR